MKTHTRFLTYILLAALLIVSPLSYSISHAQPETEDTKLALIDFKNTEISEVFKFLSLKSEYSFVASPGIKGRLTMYLKNVSVLEALDTISKSNKFAYTIDGQIIHIMTAKEYEQEYGHQFGKILKTEIIQIQHVDAQRIATILEKIKSESGSINIEQHSKMLIIKDEENNILQMKNLISRIDKPLQTKSFKLKYADINKMAESITDLLTPTIGKIKFNEASNAIVIIDNQDVIDQVSSVIKVFDQRQAEVSIEAKVIQVNLSDEYKLGIDWQAVVSQLHNMRLEGNFSNAPTSQFGRLSVGTIEDDNYSIVLDVLESIGNTKILSNPHITAVNNQEAKILVGSSEPYVTATTTTPSSGPAITAENVTFIDVGVKLFATPTIHDDGFVTMKIRPEVSSVTRTVVTSNNNTIPVVETSEAETTVIVKDGETIVIGGLIREEKINTTQQVPILGSIPIIGAPFRSQDFQTRTTELVIFLTPHIITGSTQEYKKYRSILEN